MKLYFAIVSAVFSAVAFPAVKVPAPSRPPVRRVAARPAPKPAAKPAAPAAWRREKPYRGAAVADAATGRILFQDRANVKCYPASCTKMMTFLLVLEDVKEGLYTLDDAMVGTVRATREEPSIIGIKPGQTMKVRDLLTSIMVKSANDAAVVLAENSAARRAGRVEIMKGDLEAFVERMNSRAAALGMADTHYVTPNGLNPPPGSKRGFDESTAADLVKLARACLAHPETLRFTSQKVATVRVGESEVRMVNHNNIMVKDRLKIIGPDGREEVDGMKTGYIDAGGSSIILTASRKGRRAIVVVLGSDGSAVRDEAARGLMTDALGAIAPW